MSELTAGVVAGSDRLVGFGGTSGGGGDAVFVVTFVMLCVVLSLFAIGWWFFVSDLISPVGARSDHRADSEDGSGRGTDVVFVVVFVILFLAFSLLAAGPSSAPPPPPARLAACRPFF